MNVSKSLPKTKVMLEFLVFCEAVNERGVEGGRGGVEGPGRLAKDLQDAVCLSHSSMSSSYCWVWKQGC